MPQQIEFEGAVHEFPEDFTDADIAAALGTMSGAAGERLAPMPSHDSTPTNAVPFIAAGRAARPAIVRLGEELATAPGVGRGVRSLSAPAARMAARAVGATSGSIPGYIMSEALTSPAVSQAAEKGIRAGGAGLARLAGSRLAQATTGVPGLIASLITVPGDQPVDGPVAERAAAEQRAREREFRATHPRGQMSMADLLDSMRERMRAAARNALIEAMAARRGDR